MTDGSLHGECKVFNKIGLLTRVERIQDRVRDVDPSFNNKTVKIVPCPTCGNDFEKIYGNTRRCEDCSTERNIQIQKEWKERRRETSRKRSDKDSAKGIKRRPRL